MRAGKAVNGAPSRYPGRLVSVSGPLSNLSYGWPTPGCTRPSAAGAPREEREAELDVVARARRDPAGRRGQPGAGPRSPIRSGSASSATSTGSSTRGRGAGSPASARCSSRRKTTISAPASRTRSRSRRSRPASPAPSDLCVPLTEAIALAHDCGHGPAGHASEEAFSPYLPGGYDHAVYGADVTLAPLNLCRETLDGVRNHSWRRPAPSTPEGEVVAWADRIAYVCHDFEDAVRAGILEPDDLPERGRATSSARSRSRADRHVRARGARRDRRAPATSA